jgi:hypothetical protein
MSAFKQFTTKDVIQTPFIADKGWILSGSSEITGSEYGINIFYGINHPIGSTNYDTQTGFVYSASQGNVYNSAKHLYYTNFLTQSTGDNATTQSVTPGATREDDYFFGPIIAPRFDNYLQSTLEQNRFFPTGSGAKGTITTISIPQKLFGEGIVPNTFKFTYTESAAFPTGVQVIDDGEGNLISSSITSSGGDLNTDLVVGQIFYNQGIAVFTTGSNNGNNLGALAKYIGSDLRQMKFEFSSSITIYEQQYKCTILENEFGYSTNPTLLKNSGGTGSYNVEYYDYVTSSFFEPYVTCVGLYNENTELVAVGKLSFPLPISQFTDTTIIVNYDV